MSMDFFNRMGERIERAWRAKNFDERVFAELAVAALNETRPSDYVTYRDVVTALLFGTLPPQPANLKFGEPPIFVFHHPKFYIEVLCWLDGTTAIHQHGFSGAFHVMAGSSVHSVYDFQLHERISSDFLLGDARFVSCELLRVGDVRKIEAGPCFIHALFHLDRPSISIVVRTHSEPEHHPQYEYFPPHVAVNPFDPNPIREQRQQLFTVLLNTDRDAFDQVVERTIAESELPAVYRLLNFVHFSAKTAPYVIDKEFLDRTVSAARGRFGHRVDRMMASIAVSTRISDLTEHRKKATSPELRFFLALLMNVPSRATIEELITLHMGENPIARMKQWLRDLEQVHPSGMISLLEVEVGGEGGGTCALRTLLGGTLGGMLDGMRGPALVRHLQSVLPAGLIDEIGGSIGDLETALAQGSLQGLFDR
jgi:hypothetical protein